MKNKLKKMLARLTHNLGLKLIALFFSFGLWFVVNNINDPTQSKTFYNIPVEILNEELITNEGKVYEILDGTGTVNVKVRGKESVLKYVNKEDIKATADMAELTFMNTVGIKASSSRSNAELEFDCSTDNVKFSIEDVKRIQMVINTSTTGHPADGYVVGNVTPSQNIVRISGPESVVSKINHVEAVANIGNYAYTSDINTSVDLQLYDADDKEIKNSAIKMNISSINVAITILATKEIPLRFAVQGTPEDGYVYTGSLESDVQSVLLAGKKSILDNLAEIVVSDSALDITDLSEDKTTVVNIRKMLPSGTQFADSSFGGNVNVTIDIEPLVTKQFEVPVKNFAIANIPEGFEAKIREFENEQVENFTMTFAGVSEDINKLRAKDIIGVVDLDVHAQEYEITEWISGIYVCDIHLNLSQDYISAEDYTLTVVLEKMEETQEE